MKSAIKSGPQVKVFKLEELRPAPYNPRTISDDALQGLANSLQQFGCVEPIVVNTRDGKNIIVGGHQRYKALQKLGEAKVICVTVDLCEGDEKLLNLALNNPEIQGEFIEKLVEYINSVREQLSDASDLVSLRINELRGQISNLAIGDDFFDDGAVGGIFADSDCEGITFVFSKEQAKTVKGAIGRVGKPDIAKRIVKLCQGV